MVTMTNEELLDAVDGLELDSIEATAYNYLIEETYEGLEFQGHEGERLRNLCRAILKARAAKI